MSAYQFTLFDGVTRLIGSNRIELPNDQAAVQYATQIARGLKWVRWPVHVIAENGETVGCVDPPVLGLTAIEYQLPKLDGLAPGW